MKKFILLFFCTFILLFLFVSPVWGWEAEDSLNPQKPPFTPEAKEPEGIINPVIGIFGIQPGNITIASILASFLRLALIGGGIMLIFHLTWAGLNWLTAGSDENKLRQAKDRINNSLMGIFLLALVLVIIALVNEILGLNILKPTLPTP